MIANIPRLGIDVPNRFGGGAGTLASPANLPMIAIRWDGFNQYTDTDYNPNGQYNSHFNYRYSPLYTNGRISGPGVDTTAIITQENAIASAAGITAWMWDFYTPSAVVHAADPQGYSEALNLGLESFLVSPNAHLMNFCVNVLADDRFGLFYPSTTRGKYLVDF